MNWLECLTLTIGSLAAISVPEAGGNLTSEVLKSPCWHEDVRDLHSQCSGLEECEKAFGMGYICVDGGCVHVSQVFKRVLLDVLEFHEGDVVVDIGAGNGWLSEKAALKSGPGGAVYASDIKETRFRELGRLDGKLSAAGTPHAPIHARLARNPLDTAMDDLAENTVDVVLMIESVNFRKTQKRKDNLDYLGRFARMLKPGGRLVLLNEYLFSNSLTPQETRDLFQEAGFGADARVVALPDAVPLRQLRAKRPGAPLETVDRGFLMIFSMPR